MYSTIQLFQVTGLSGMKIIYNPNMVYDVIYLKDLDTGKTSIVYPSPYDQYGSDIYGTKIVWSQTGPLGIQNIYMKDIVTRKIIILNANKWSQVVPAISGNRIVWEQYYSKGSYIYLRTL